MDKVILSSAQRAKTQFPRDELLSRLIVSDATFLTLREKFAFLSALPRILADKDGPGSFEERFPLVSIDDISVCVGRVFSRVRWDGRAALKKALVSLKILDSFGIRCVCFDSDDFPAMLREMRDPPFMIFYRGNLDVLRRKCVSVVGTRRASPQSKRACEEFARAACDDGLCVVSGLAFGIDAAGHKGALLSRTPATCAVLPSGIDTITPQSHTALAARILESGGLILSEYAPGTPALQFRFVQRNRIVAALSPATVVIQAPAGSGAMITAGLALDYNREVLFHNQCFSKEAIAINEISELQWKKLIAQGKKVDYKLSDTPRGFVEDGARVISDYSEFKELTNG